VLAVLRFDASDDDREFLEQAREALTLLAARPGFQSGLVGQAYDEPGLWCLVTEWESVGAYRRALGSYEVRARATPLLTRARPEPSAYEPLAVAGDGGPTTVRSRESDRSGPGAG
jgi:hypothetical protein